MLDPFYLRTATVPSAPPPPLTISDWQDIIRSLEHRADCPKYEHTHGEWEEDDRMIAQKLREWLESTLPKAEQAGQTPVGFGRDGAY